MKIRIRPRIITAFLILSICSNYYYLVDMNSEFWKTSIEYSQLATGLALLWGLYCFFSINNKVVKYKYFYYMLGFIAIICLSSFQSYIQYNQKLISGILAQSFILVWVMLYFPIVKNVYYNKITLDDLKKLIKLVGTIQLIVFISQYFLTGIYDFVYVHISFRYGQIRYYFNPIMLDLLLLFELDNLLQKDNNVRFIKKVSSFCYIAAIMFEVMIVQKHRLTTLGLGICVALGVFLSKGITFRKIVYIFIVALLIVFFMNTTMAGDIINELVNGKQYGGAESSLAIRSEGRMLYLRTFISHPILGGGYPQYQNSAALEASGYSSGLLFSDNGFFGLLYVYGGVGIILIIALWIKMIRNGWKIFKANGQLVYLLFPLFLLITGINEANWYWMNGIMVFVLFLIIQEHEFLKIYNNFVRKKIYD